MLDLDPECEAEDVAEFAGLAAGAGVLGDGDTCGVTTAVAVTVVVILGTTDDVVVTTAGLALLAEELAVGGIPTCAAIWGVDDELSLAAASSLTACA